MKKTHWKKVFNSDFLGACDLEDGRDVIATIKDVLIKKVKNTDGKEHERNVAYFDDTKIKPMILNATNCKIIKKFANSNYINDWKNIPIQIYVKDDIRAFGEVTEGLRIRETQPLIVSDEVHNEIKEKVAQIANTDDLSEYYKILDGRFKTPEIITLFSNRKKELK